MTDPDRTQLIVDGLAGLSFEDIKAELIKALERLGETRADSGLEQDFVDLFSLADIIREG